jgi:hypothetical protein
VGETGESSSFQIFPMGFHLNFLKIQLFKAKIITVYCRGYNIALRSEGGKWNCSVVRFFCFAFIKLV